MTWLSAGSEIAHLATSVRDPHDHYLIPNVAESTRPRSGVTDCQVIDHLLLLLVEKEQLAVDPLAP